jgi:16S rRNA (guanine966-N2)-methyltransferase
MKIIGGRYKGQTIEAARGVLSRPPLAIIRESIFNILGRSLEGSTVLDLFAGSGSLGLEALSRGAGRVHFVDSARRCVDMIRRNVAKIGAGDACTVSRQKALDFVRAWQGQPFSLIFIDPPFLSAGASMVLGALPSSRVFSDQALAVARIHWREDIQVPQSLRVVRRRKFGENVVLFVGAAGLGVNL